MLVRVWKGKGGFNREVTLFFRNLGKSMPAAIDKQAVYDCQDRQWIGG